MYTIELRFVRNGVHIKFNDTGESTIEQLRAHMAEHLPEPLRAQILDPVMFALFAHDGSLPLSNEDATIDTYIRMRPTIARKNVILIIASERRGIVQRNSSRKTRKAHARTRRSKSRNNRR